MNHTRLPKDVLLSHWARRYIQVITGRSCISSSC